MSARELMTRIRIIEPFFSTPPLQMQLGLYLDDSAIHHKNLLD